MIMAYHGVDPGPDRGTHHLPSAPADHRGSGMAAAGQTNAAPRRVGPSSTTPHPSQHRGRGLNPANGLSPVSS